MLWLKKAAFHVFLCYCCENECPSSTSRVVALVVKKILSGCERPWKFPAGISGVALTPAGKWYTLNKTRDLRSSDESYGQVPMPESVARLK